ncbi:MAG: hypothetical protein JXA52_00180, partial [Planctomycetes bacterium]|nr:hypothetical protein [Planctomycetota bacterium]
MMSKAEIFKKIIFGLTLLLFALSGQLMAVSEQQNEGDWYYSGSTITATTSSVAGWLTVDSNAETTTTSIVLGAGADAFSLAPAQGTIEISGVRAMQVDIYGELSNSGAGATAIFFNDAQATINNYGTITAKIAIQTGAANDSVNFNTTSSEVYTSGIVILDGGDDTLSFLASNNNIRMTGSALMGVGDDTINVNVADTTVTIDSILTGDGETATTASAINLGEGDDTIVIGGFGVLAMDGAAHTAVVAGDGNDTLFATGTNTITSLTITFTSDDNADGIDFGGGNDRANLNSGLGEVIVNGVLAMGEDTNTIAITTGIGDTTVNGRITAGSNDDLMTITLAGGTATVSSVVSGVEAIDLGGADDTLTISGYGTLAVDSKNATALTVGTGNDIITVQATNSVSSLTVNLTNDMVADGLELDAGNDGITFNASAGSIDFNGTLAGGTGTDTMTIVLDNGRTITISGPVDLGDEDDTTNITGAGNLLLTSNYGDASSLTLGAGDDFVTVSANDATSRLVVTLGGGNNGINLGAGDNQLSLNATANNLILNGEIEAGANDDAVSLSVTAGYLTVNGALRLGDGNNTLAIIGNGSADNILSVTGDFYTGAGDDMMTITDAAVDADIYLGDAGTDMVTFAGSSDMTYDGQIQQATSLIKEGSGTWLFSNAYSAGTRLATVAVDQGTLILGNDSTDFFGEASGTTDLTVGGAGFSATLRANGVVTANTVMIANSGTLSGTGRVGAQGGLTVNSGGTIAPGNSIGTLTIDGNVVFEEGSHYNVEISGSTSDLLDITGSATNEGANIHPSIDGYIGDGYTFTIISAAGGYIESTPFSITQPTDTAILSFSVSSNPGAVMLIANRRSFQSVPTIPTHLLGMATAINDLGQGSGDMADIIATLSLLSPEDLAAAMQQMSPEVLAGVAQAGLATTGAINNSIAGRTSEVRTAMLEQRSGPMGPAGPARTQNAGDGYGVWARSVGSWADQDNDGEFLGYEYDIYGIVWGIDKQVEDSVFGISMG